MQLFDSGRVPTQPTKIANSTINSRKQKNSIPFKTVFKNDNLVWDWSKMLLFFWPITNSADDYLKCR